MSTGAMSDALRTALQMHCDDDWASVTFRPPFLRLLDVDHCSVLSAQLAELGEWEIRSAVPDLQLPDAPGLYMFVWRPTLVLKAAQAPHERTFPWVLYCGRTGAGASTNTLASRFRTGYSKYLIGEPSDLFLREPPADRAGRLGRYLQLRPLEFWFLEIDDQVKIAQLEKRLIKALAPPLNSQHNPSRLPVRSGKPVSAFKEI
ncbi:hypothetical protein ACI78R_07145 [Geodermatophilus sp. SYSU D01106]